MMTRLITKLAATAGLPVVAAQLHWGLTLNLAPLQAAVLGLGLNYAAYEAEIHRLKGELVLQQHSEAGASSKAENEAEASYRRALQVARDQCAKSWELRAAMSLARLWRRQDRREEARAILAPIYEWFTEGLETRDLSEARALLEILN